MMENESQAPLNPKLQLLTVCPMFYYGYIQVGASERKVITRNDSTKSTSSRTRHTSRARPSPRTVSNVACQHPAKTRKIRRCPWSSQADFRRLAQIAVVNWRTEKGTARVVSNARQSSHPPPRYHEYRGASSKVDWYTSFGRGNTICKFYKGHIWNILERITDASPGNVIRKSNPAISLDIPEQNSALADDCGKPRDPDDQIVPDRASNDQAVPDSRKDDIPFNGGIIHSGSKDGDTGESLFARPLLLPNNQT